ncbi:MAG: aspartate aminotransferase family protein [Deltaproteobacteria bacterium]|nr:aspartate aminotransferase family protein [Deltaproteobacteria bacterium]
MDAARVREKHKKYLFPSVINYYQTPLVLERGQGCLIWDADGNRYLDMFGGILTVSVGHCHPEVNAAVKSQLDLLGHTSTLYPTEPIVDLAERLARLTPGKLEQSFFTSSGTEADETAVMLAQTHTGHSELIALRHGYSGRSLMGQALTAHAPWRVLPTQVAAIKHAHNPYCYRCPMKLTYPGCQLQCGRDIEELIRTTTTGRVAGILLEPIQGVGGFIVAPRDYIPLVVDIVHKADGLFICDEVQTGFGRTGGTFWGIEHWGVEPDVMTMAKGIANGFSIGATVTRPEIAASIKALTISTFGGNPITSAAANATIDCIVEHKLAHNAEERGGELRAGLEALKRDHPRTVGDVRGMGLMQALELVVDETAQDRTPNTQATLALFEETRKRGLLIGKGGLHGNVIRISPPLTIDAGQIKDAIKILGDSLRAIGA